MPLSEHEQRLLDQIERALYAEDPKFASTVRSTDLKTHLLRRVKRAVVLLTLGLLVLVVGAVVGGTAGLVVGVSGFLVMLSAGLVIARSASRMSGKAEVAAGPRSTGRRSRRRAKGGGGRPSWRERFEERWRRRWEDRD